MKMEIVNINYPRDREVEKQCSFEKIGICDRSPEFIFKQEPFYTYDKVKYILKPPQVIKITTPSSYSDQLDNETYYCFGCKNKILEMVKSQLDPKLDLLK